MFKQYRTPLMLVLLAAAVAPRLLAQGPAPTNFGSVPVNSSTTQTLTFTVASTASFSLQYGNGSEFTLGVPSCSGSTCTLPVIFLPLYPGLRSGAIIATDQSGHLLATGLVYGIGLGPQIAIGPGVISTVANRASASLTSAILGGVAVALGGNVYVADSHNNLVLAVNTTSGQVTTYAGNTIAGYAGDGGLALNAELHSPSALAFDDAGNLYIADTGNNVIREVNAFSRVITTVAGNGAAGFSGDGGAATSAQLSSPAGVAVDQTNGKLYIADANNNRVRQVNAGIINTVVGTGVAGYTGDNGPAAAATLSHPLSLAIDANGNGYIADSNNNAIREVVGATGNIVTVAGTGVAGNSGDGGAATSADLNAPEGVAVDAGGNIYIADTANNVIRKVTGDSNHIISTVAGRIGAAGYTGDGGASTSATLSLPTGIAVDPSGNVFFVDFGNNALREVTAGPAPLTFPATANGQTSAPTTLTVSNTGNQNLVFSSLSLTGNFSQQSSANACSSSSTLAQGGFCTVALAFSPTLGGNTSGTATINTNSVNTSNVQNQVALSESTGLLFIAVTPCRVADTRNATGAFGGPLLSGQTTRNFVISQSACSIPSTAQAYSLNATVVPNQPLGYLTMWPAGQSQPTVSTLNSIDGRIKANAAIVPAGSGGAISVFASNDTNFVLDIDGYFVPQSTASALAFFPLTPCRIADTRSGSGSFGPPFISGQSTRAFPILSSACNVPSTAQAYSMNFTVVPRNGGALGYLTTWPAGQTQPLVSTLNALTGTVTANAAIVPAGTNGSINVFASNDTDLVIDINGYFAGPATGGLSLYNVQPCRALDTRVPAGSQPINGYYSPRGSSNAGNTCGSTLNSLQTQQAYVANVTVVPTAALGYLTIWSQGEAQPFESTLNALDGAVTSNLAIVPTTNGNVSVFVSNSTHLVIDIFGYFAP